MVHPRGWVLIGDFYSMRTYMAVARTHHLDAAAPVMRRSAVRSFSQCARHSSFTAILPAAPSSPADVAGPLLIHPFAVHFRRANTTSMAAAADYSTAIHVDRSALALSRPPTTSTSVGWSLLRHPTAARRTYVYDCRRERMTLSLARRAGDSIYRSRRATTTACRGTIASMRTRSISATTSRTYTRFLTHWVRPCASYLPHRRSRTGFFLLAFEFMDLGLRAINGKLLPSWRVKRIFFADASICSATRSITNQARCLSGRPLHAHTRPPQSLPYRRTPGRDVSSSAAQRR
ncbi:hypothetical protein B0H19DRAFT_578931 [Mycena capillaripes]|nr:hypothetical protein B0H19DRAFT_578931 [Mycena capillaripes]